MQKKKTINDRRMLVWYTLKYTNNVNASTLNNFHGHGRENEWPQLTYILTTYMQNAGHSSVHSITEEAPTTNTSRPAITCHFFFSYNSNYLFNFCTCHLLVLLPSDMDRNVKKERPIEALGWGQTLTCYLLGLNLIGIDSTIINTS